MIDASLNHYRVVRALGSGGMGEVYEAEDTKLHRRVAVKVLAPAVANDPERRQRFEREARAVAALNHPNIVTIYSIEHDSDRLFLTMELVRGVPLSRVITARGLPIAQFLAFAVPLAEAISAAHQQGIIHRDLKPDNIMVGDDGRLKVLDFGLAQLKEVADSDAVTMLRTHEGSVMGTVAYMSPEQAQGLPVDARSDIFALGIVLFEMATGERPFTSNTAVGTLSSIVKDPAPSVAAINPSQPADLARVVRRCLAKDPARRYQTAADVRNELEDLRQEIESGRSVPVPSALPRKGGRVREAVAWGLAATMLVAALVAVFVRPRAIAPAPDVFSLLPPENTALTEGEAPQVSPNGATISFVATDQSGKTLLYLRDRRSLITRAVPDSDDATLPFWAPDSLSIGFFAGGTLKRVTVAGGRPQTLALAPVPRGGTWSKDDVIVYVPFPEEPPHRIPAAGGPPTALPIQPGVLRWLPSILPDGRHYLYLAYSRGRSLGVHVGSIDAPDAKLLLESNASASYVDSGHLIFRREESLFAQPFNGTALRLEGNPVAIADRVSFNPITQQTMASASGNGVLAYISAAQDWQLTWFNDDGRRVADAGTIGGYNSLCLSSDGKRLVYDLADSKSGNVDLWSLDLTLGTTSHLTFHPSADFYVACSPTTDEVIFSSPRTGTPNLYRLALSSPGGEASIADETLPFLPSQWSSDGKFVLFSAYSKQTNFDVWMMPLVEGARPTTVIATDAVEKGGQLSRDGRWLAYASGQGGNYEIYIQPFPATGARWQISKGGGRQPQWAPDGRRLFFISPAKELIAVDVDGATSRLVVGATRVLMDTRVGGWERTHLGNPYAVSAEGRLLVANASHTTLPMTVILNWRALESGGGK